VVRLPIEQYDDGSYRCAIEVARSITRHQKENINCRQLRRQAVAEDMRYMVRVRGKKKVEEKDYRYNPRLELFADIGRNINFALSGGRELAHMTFTKRATKQSIGKQTEVDHKDVVADVELKISAKQGPDEPQERFKWLAAIRQYYEHEGFGQVHHALAGATDLVMCQKELISLTKEPREWHPKIDKEINDQMIEFLTTDELWERSK
jgi:hypothetical protein